jgi:phytoene dehydrogenase-like protein
VHIGGTIDQIAASEHAAVRGEHHERPFVLLVQSSLFDETRAPAGKHTAWGYCHVPHGSTRDMTGGSSTTTSCSRCCCTVAAPARALRRSPDRA